MDSVEIVIASLCFVVLLFFNPFLSYCIIYLHCSVHGKQFEPSIFQLSPQALVTSCTLILEGIVLFLILKKGWAKDDFFDFSVLMSSFSSLCYI